MWSFHTVIILLVTYASLVSAGNKNKPHGHNGTLAHYDGKPLPFKVTGEQNKKLEQGQPVRTSDCWKCQRLDLFESHSTMCTNRSPVPYRLLGTKKE